MEEAILSYKRCLGHQRQLMQELLLLDSQIEANAFLKNPRRSYLRHRRSLKQSDAAAAQQLMPPLQIVASSKQRVPLRSRKRSEASIAQPPNSGPSTGHLEAAVEKNLAMTHAIWELLQAQLPPQHNQQQQQQLMPRLSSSQRRDCAYYNDPSRNSSSRSTKSSHNSSSCWSDETNYASTRN